MKNAGNGTTLCKRDHSSRISLSAELERKMNYVALITEFYIGSRLLSLQNSFQ